MGTTVSLCIYHHTELLIFFLWWELLRLTLLPTFKALCCMHTLLISRKSTWAIVWVVTWNGCSFHKKLFLRERWADNTDCDYSDFGVGRYFLKKEQCYLVTLWETTNWICCQCLILSFQQKLAVWKTQTQHWG